MINVTENQTLVSSQQSGEMNDAWPGRVHSNWPWKFHSTSDSRRDLPSESAQCDLSPSCFATPTDAPEQRRDLPSDEIASAIAAAAIPNAHPFLHNSCLLHRQKHTSTSVAVSSMKHDNKDCSTHLSCHTTMSHRVVRQTLTGKCDMNVCNLVALAADPTLSSLNNKAAVWATARKQNRCSILKDTEM
jgi:hypothetical protein